MTRYSAWRLALLFTHRWLGIAGGLLFLAWFASGIVMLYARMPHLGPADRLRKLEPLDLASARVEPAEVVRAAGIPEPVHRLRIAMLAGRPVYRIFATPSSAAPDVSALPPGWQTLFADTGQPLLGLTPGQAVSVATRFASETGVSSESPSRAVRNEALLHTPDQWTLQLRLFLPLHRIALADPAAIRLYVSDRTGEVVLETSRSSRAWAYLGAVLHWLYFTPFRIRSGLWLQTMIWISIAGCVLALSGLVWGVLRLSRRVGRRYPGGSLGHFSPYTGAMRWHHYAGLVFGLFTFTWVLSGCLSLDPWSWHPGTSPSLGQRLAIGGGPLQIEELTLPRLRAALGTIEAAFAPDAPPEVELVQFRGEPFLIAHRPPAGDAEPRHASVTAFLSPVQPFPHALVPVRAPDSLAGPFPRDALLAAAAAAMPRARVAESTWLESFDAYYYERYDPRPLPVLRVRFDDPERTWLYLDPARGLPLHRETGRTRLNRWLYHGLHSLDLPFLAARRSLRDAIVILLAAGGMVLVLSSMGAGWRRLGRHLRRLTGGRRFTGPPPGNDDRPSAARRRV